MNMMQELTNRMAYPKELAAMIERSGAMGMALANRWMLGWPARVAALIEANEYQAAFEIQLAQEQDADASPAPHSHLSSWEKREVMGLREAPPSAKG